MTAAALGRALVWICCRAAYAGFWLQGKRGKGVEIHLMGDSAEWRAP